MGILFIIHQILLLVCLIYIHKIMNRSGFNFFIRQILDWMKKKLTFAKIIDIYISWSIQCNSIMPFSLLFCTVLVITCNGVLIVGSCSIMLTAQCCFFLFLHFSFSTEMLSIVYKTVKRNDCEAVKMAYYYRI